MAWYDLVCFEKNKENIILTFKYFGLEYGKDFYEVQHWNGTTSIVVIDNGLGVKYVYKIILDKELECAKILERNTIDNFIEKERYHALRDKKGKQLCFKGYDVWYDSLNYLFGDRKGKNKV